MAKKEIRLSLEDIDNNGSPEVLVEFYEGNELVFASAVSSSGEDKTYDTVNVRVDMDEDGDLDADDERHLLSLCQAFAGFAR
ncbi:MULTISPECIES: hypothetical protein [Pseudomonas]|uniref:Uncharacterized protein n=1 Tax=Pseudomonas asplenii TaxID=53407 RepID=A0A0M9GC70_9PSED|nr:MULTISPECIES: hypothetical protein [Pseudomonas]KPA87396.1 hypothetical protein PF66_06026 [Pseudomonas fuscovaginae]